MMKAGNDERHHVNEHQPGGASGDSAIDRAVNSVVDIVAIGEALIDIVSTDAGTAEHPGGSPMNVAFGLGRLGERVQLLTALGDDPRGRAIAEHVGSGGVTLFPGSVTGSPTSTATAHLDENGAASYVFAIEWSLSELERMPRADLLHIGSIGAFLEPGASTVESIVTAARDESVVTFDPNIRPALMGDPAVAVARFRRLAASADLVKMSDEDAAWLYPDASVDAVLASVLELGPAVAAITLGPHGAALATKSTRVDIPGVAVAVADTIGAGDSFMSALVHSLARLLAGGTPRADIKDGSAFTQDRLTTIGDFAVGCAAITVSRAGANPPTLAEVEAAAVR